MKRVTPLTAVLCAAALLPLPLQAQKNTNQATSSAIASGISNTIVKGANYSFIGSGWRNLIKTNGADPNGMSFIGGGQSNTVGANWSVINGGFLNRISPNDTNGQMSFIGSGGENLIQGKYAVIAGGYNNLVSSNAAGGAIGGGYYNDVSAVRGTVPGGSYNEAGGSNSFAAGSYAVASNAGTFVWGDMSSTNDFASTGRNQFLIRASGGVGIGTNNPGTNALLVNGAVVIDGNLTATSINGQTNFTGTAGSNGLAATIAVGTVTNGAPGTTALVTNIGTSNAAVFNFTIPSGANGAAGTNGINGLNGTNGSDGLAATIAVGTVTNGAPGTTALVTNIGTSNAAVFNFTIPSGANGTNGINGSPGLNGTNGSDGAPGAAAVISGVTASNGPAGTLPSVTNIGSSTNASFAFTFPLVLPSGGAGVGTNNTAPGLNAVVAGGNSNTASTNWATISGGRENAASETYTTIGGGLYNTASSTAATIGGGRRNTNAGALATIGGGQENTASDSYATIGGGQNNEASDPYATIGGGAFNNASGYISTIGGGQENTNSGEHATIGGGQENTASDFYATIGGGTFNNASGYISTIGGGENNNASGYGATVSGGTDNTASGDYATIPGGQLNVAANSSFAAGTQAKATNNGSFVWADSKDAEFGSTDSNQFLIRAQNGVGINTNNTVVFDGEGNPVGTNALSVNGPVQIGTIQVLTGLGIPTITAPNGSIYLRTDGIESETLYIRSQDLWLPVFVSSGIGG